MREIILGVIIAFALAACPLLEKGCNACDVGRSEGAASADSNSTEPSVANSADVAQVDNERSEGNGAPGLVDCTNPLWRGEEICPED